MTKHSLLPMSPAAPAKVRSDSDMACVANRTCQQRRSTFAAAAPARQTIPRWLRRGVHRSLPSANPSLAYASYSAAHYTGKSRIACTKGIIFAATVIIASLSVTAMVVARRALQEALLAGLLQCLVGFVLVVEIHDFL
jgi:hypothetical protein